MQDIDEGIWTGIFQGWAEAATYFLLLLVVLAIWGWAAQLGLRPADRKGLIPWPVVLICFAVVLVLRQFDGTWLQVGVMAAGVVVGGLLSRMAGRPLLWVPAVLLAVLMGMGLMLSALVLSVAGLLVLIFSPARS